MESTHNKYGFSLGCSLFLIAIFLSFSLGRALFPRLQAKVRLLQVQTEETSKCCVMLVYMWFVFLDFTTDLYNNVDGFDLWIITIQTSQFVIKYASLHEL